MTSIGLSNAFVRTNQDNMVTMNGFFTRLGNDIKKCFESCFKNLRNSPNSRQIIPHPVDITQEQRQISDIENQIHNITDSSEDMVRINMDASECTGTVCIIDTPTPRPPTNACPRPPTYPPPKLNINFRKNHKILSPPPLAPPPPCDVEPFTVWL